jgi:hypothetical protein
MANEKDKRKAGQPVDPAPTEQIQTPATPQGLGTTPAQQFGQPVQQGIGGGTLGVNTDLNNPTTPTTAPTEQATPATPAKSATQELIDSIKAGSEEERQKIERRRRAEETISGISDMGKALSNLYFTGKGAPNMYDPKTAMTPKARERYERALKNWEKNRAASMQYALSKQKADLAEESNRLKERQLNDLADYRAEEQRRKQEQLDFTKAQKEIENALKEEGLNVREGIARMNNATRQMSISQRSTLISPYKKVKQKVRDPKTGEVSEIEYRFTVDPITGEIKGEELRDVSGGKNKTGGTTTQATSTQTATAGQNGGNNNYSGNLKNTRNLNL